MTATLTSYTHLLALSDDIGLFEHAQYTRPRREHGYCVDDVARGLLVLSRAGDAHDRAPGELIRVAWTYLRFIAGSQDGSGKVVNRRDVDGVQHGVFGVEDCWGRALWGLGTAAARIRDPELSRQALSRFDVSVRARSPWPHAMTFAGLGAVEVLRVDSGHAEARALLQDCAAMIPQPRPAQSWPWPWPRLTYANASVPDLLMAAGDCLGDDRMIAAGLAMLEWLVEVETVDGRLSVTPVGGWAPGEPRPGFDQQPIEVAALADACARAHELTGDARWSDALSAAASWFLGANDASIPLYDPTSGGCRDGLEASGCNENQGAESTLAMISTFQHARRLAPVHV